MERDSFILFRHPESGEVRPGYYGFSWDSLWSFGLVWLRRSPRLALQYLNPLCLFLAGIVITILPNDTALDIGGTFVPLKVLFGGGMMGICLAAHVIYAFQCNRVYTRMMRDLGYEMLPGVNQQEARAALGFDADEEKEKTHGKG